MTQRMRSFVVGIIASFVALVGAGLPATASAATGPLVTPAQAAAEVRTYLAANNRANAALSIPLQDKLEAGSANAIDDAYFRIAKRDALPATPKFTAGTLRVFLSRQVHYPVAFVALLRPELGAHAILPDTRVLLFQRQSSGSHWKLTSEPDVPAGDPLPQFIVGKDGYTPSLQGIHLTQTRDSLVHAWIAAEKATALGQLPSAAWSKTPLLIKHDWTNSIVDSISRPAIVETDTFAPSKSAPACLASVNGALCFVSTVWTAFISQTPQALTLGHRLLVSSSAAQYAAGGVAKGRYLTLKVTTEQESAIEVPTGHRRTALRELADEWGALSGSGTVG